MNPEDYHTLLGKIAAMSICILNASESKPDAEDPDVLYLYRDGRSVMATLDGTSTRLNAAKLYYLIRHTWTRKTSIEFDGFA